MQRIFSINKNVLFVSLLFVFGSAFAQKDSIQKGKIDTEKLIIVKPYSPTVSDAFKVKQTPSINDSTERKKKEVNYDIFSFPVASTFTPEKGRAANVQRKSAPRLYDNYAAIGFGNYSNVMAEFYGNLNVSKNSDLGISLNHNSSQGGIKDVKLDDKYYDTALNLDYTAQAESFSWGLNLGGQHQLYNWYGVPEALNLDAAEYRDIDPQQTYLTVNAGANIDMNEGVFDKASIQYRRFSDDYKSGENRVLFDPSFQIPAGEQVMDFKFTGDYVSGVFEQDYFNSGEIKYSFFNLGFQPSIKITEGDLAVNLGAQLVYSIDGENDDNNFYVYPKVEGSYRVANEYFIVYAGLDGELKQNSYYEFVQKNPYVSPTLGITPTDKQYHGFIGGKGKFTENISYDIRGSYTSEKAKPLFMHNVAITPERIPEIGYKNLNSFGVVYDDVTTFTGFGELKATVNEQFSVSLNAAFHSYSTDKQEEAWNLPNFEASLNGNYQITEKWSAGASIFYVGERKERGANDEFIIPGTTPLDPVNLSVYNQQPDDYIDANLRVGYKLNNQLAFFLRGNNLFGQNYQRWAHYPVQGIQVMGGASYQFDW